MLSFFYLKETIMNVIAVIGANYGDEGKGLMTAYFSNKNKHKNTLVVRFNGGAQAGHTVVDGAKRHVFGHIGSGAFSAVPTLLTEDFIINPDLLLVELNRLKPYVQATPIIYAHNNCVITTIFDMWWNQALENSRTDNRHGSCGVGINATLERSKEISLTLGDFEKGKQYIMDTLESIRQYYIKLYEQRSELKPVKLNYDLNIVERATDVLLSASHKLFPYSDYNDIFTEYDTLIFEGAQGLLLSKNNMKDFPHLTPSDTGVGNIVQILNTLYAPPKEIEVVYVSRSYLTRHGNGPMIHKFPEQDMYIESLKDSTNITNVFQGTMRYGGLNMDRLIERVYADFNKMKVDYPEARMNIALTCLDKLKIQHENYPIRYLSFSPEHRKVVDALQRN